MAVLQSMAVYLGTYFAVEDLLLVNLYVVFIDDMILNCLGLVNFQDVLNTSLHKKFTHSVCPPPLCLHAQCPSVHCL